MLNLIKPIALGAVLALVAPAAFARDVTILTTSSGSSLPSFVLQAKAAEFLPEGTNIVLKAAGEDKESMIKALKMKEVDFATIFHGLGAKLHTKGLSHLQLTGIHAWGGMAIVSKTDIKPGDWEALKGKSMLVTPGMMSPQHKTSMAAMLVHGVNPKVELMMAGAKPGAAFTQMASADNAPDLVILSEPQLSHGLLNMEKQDWPTKYHVFADSAQSVTVFGVSTAGLWAVGEQEDTKAIVEGYEKAVDYMMDPANREEVAQIMADGFKATFGKNPPAKVFSNMLERNILRMRFKSAAALESRLYLAWEKAGLVPDRSIIWHGYDFKVPNQPMLASQMLPRHVGMALAYAEELKLTKKTQMAAIRIREWAHKPMLAHLKDVKKAEAEVLAGYMANDWDAVDAALVKLSEIKLAASRTQIMCIKRTQEEYAPEDIEKIRKFMAENADIAAEFGHM